MNLLLHLIAFGLVGSGTLRAARRSDASRGIALTHAFLVALMAFLHIASIGSALFLLKVVLHDGTPQWSQELHLALSILPPSATILTWLLFSTAASLFWIPVLLGLSRGAGIARYAIVKLLPLAYFVDAMEGYFSTLHHVTPSALDASLPHRLTALAAWHVLFLLLFGWFYVWVFLFYRSKASDPLFEKAGAVTQSDSE